MSPASDIIPPTSVVRWNVWNELLLLYDQTGPTRLASHRSVLAREELQLKGKEAKQKKKNIAIMCLVYNLYTTGDTQMEVIRVTSSCPLSYALELSTASA